MAAVESRRSGSSVQRRKYRATQRAECSSWLEAAAAIKSRSAAAEREIVAYWDKLAINMEDVSDALVEVYADRKQFQQEYDRVMAKKLRLHQAVTSVSSHLVASTKATPHWIQEAQRTLKTIDVQLSASRHSHAEALRILDTEQVQLEQELARTAVVISADSTDPIPMERSYSSQHSQNREQPKEVAALDAFLSKYGTTGGWPSEDHNTFLRLQSQAVDDQEMLISQMQLETGRSRENVAEHALFHATYTRLLEAKHEAIRIWKLQRNSGTSSIPVVSRCRPAPLAGEGVKKRAQQKVALAEWKQNQQRRQEEETSRLREAEEMRARIAAEEQQRRKETKERVAQYHEQKVQLRAARARSSSLHAKPVVTEEMLVRLHVRDKELVKKRLKAIDDKNVGIVLSERRRRQDEIVTGIPRKPAARSFSRLTQPTIASHLRCNEDLDETDEQKASNALLTRGPCYVSPTPTRFEGRAIVAWCGGSLNR
ncbi:hypothetical protein DIPPA_19137 [Diplonema papillatum]|nr:hypothetical protein DIPPA_19137 [Diplonema papillatum]